MTSSYLNRNIVIASVGNDGQQIILSHQTGNQLPTTRENGGDLINGDTFFDTEEEVFYTYDNAFWVPVGGPGIVSEILDRLEKIETQLASLIEIESNTEI